MHCESVVFSGHAVRRMFERAIGESDVQTVLQAGETIARYEDDSPFPSELLLGFVEGKPLHVLAAEDPENHVCYVITAYAPSAANWQPDFRARK